MRHGHYVLKRYNKLNKYYNTSLIERFISDGNMYETVDELKASENDPEESGRINWDVWDKVVQDTREQVFAYGNHIPPKKKPFMEVYVYNYDGQFVGKYGSARETAHKMGFKESTVQYLVWKNRPYLSARLYFSREQLTPEEVRETIEPYINTTRRIEGNGSSPVPKYVYNLEGEFLGYFNSTADVAERFNITSDSVNYYSWLKKPYKKHGLIISNTPLTND